MSLMCRHSFRVMCGVNAANIAVLLVSHLVVFCFVPIECGLGGDSELLFTI